MKPITARVANYTAAKPIETTTVAVYERILWMFDEERRALEAEVWAPHVSAVRFRRLHAHHTRLLEDIALVAGMRDRHLGHPLPTAKRPTLPASPDHGYGES